MKALNQIWAIAKREQKRMLQRGIYTFCMVIAPIVAFLFFTTLMGEGLPSELPAGVVDADNTSTTREVIRNLDAFQQTDIIEHYPDVAAARKAMQQGKIYAFYYIPQGTTELAIAAPACEPWPSAAGCVDSADCASVSPFAPLVSIARAESTEIGESSALSVPSAAARKSRREQSAAAVAPVPTAFFFNI